MEIVALIVILLICFCLLVLPSGKAADRSKENHYDVWRIPAKDAEKPQKGKRRSGCEEK